MATTHCATSAISAYPQGYVALHDFDGTRRWFTIASIPYGWFAARAYIAEQNDVDEADVSYQEAISEDDPADMILIDGRPVAYFVDRYQMDGFHDRIAALRVGRAA